MEYPKLNSRKRWAFLSFIFIIGLVTILSFGYSSEFFDPTVPLRELQMEIVTDKAEYSLGETINTTFYIVNNSPHPVRMDPFNQYVFNGNSVDDSNKVGALVFVDWVQGATITIPAGSKFRFQEYSFKPTLKGSFTIQVSICARNDGLSGSLTVMVR